MRAARGFHGTGRATMEEAQCRPRNAERRINSPVRIQIRGLTSRRLPLASLRKVKEIRPRLRPVAMLKVSGVATTVRKAGKASVKSSQWTRATARHLKLPTKIRAGAVGSIFYGLTDGIPNPIVPLAPGCTAYNAVTGATGAGSTPALKASCFTLPLLQPGALGRAIPPGDTFETDFTSGQRNIFRQAWQKRADISLVKDLRLTERVSLKYTLDVFNVTNTASFDIPIDNVSQNQYYNDFPAEGQPLYNAPFGLGAVNKTIGGPRQIQMALHLAF